MSSDRSDFDKSQSDDYTVEDDEQQSLGDSIDSGLVDTALSLDVEISYPRRTADARIRIARSPEWFGDRSHVAIVECNLGEKVSDGKLDDNGLEDHFKVELDGGTERPSLRVAFIAWKKSIQFDLSLRGMDIICKAFNLSPAFVSGILEVEYMTPLGYAYIIDRDETGSPKTLEIFYEYAFSLKSGKAYVVRQYDYNLKSLTYVCINCPENVVRTFLRDADPQDLPKSWGDSFSLDIAIVEESLKSFTKDISELRLRLLEYERKQHLHSAKHTTIDLHNIAQRWHILLGNLSSFEEWVLFILKSARRAPKRFLETPDSMKLELILTKVVHLKTWVANYKDRTNIRINLSFHLAQQSDNETNLQISNYTSVIARDTQQDSSSMITIAAVTMLFLPGTFICAIFSMIFFDIEHDANGNENFWVSKRWWYYVAVTAPLTLAVFVAWIVWRSRRFRRHQTANAKILGEKDES